MNLRDFLEEDYKVWMRDVKLVFRINHTLPYTEDTTGSCTSCSEGGAAMLVDTIRDGNEEQ